MGILDNLLKKAPQSVKDKYKIKIKDFYTTNLN